MELADKISPFPLEEMSQANRDMYNILWEGLTSKTVQLEAQLNAWYATLKAQNQHHHGGELYRRSPSTLYQQLPLTSHVRELPFEFFLCFPDSDIAQQVVLHWTGLLLLQSTLWLAKERLRCAGYTATFPTYHSSSILGNQARVMGSGSLAGHTPRPIAPQALLITQSLEYFVHPDMGFLGTNFVGFPMAVAQGAYEYLQAPELAWFDVVFERMQQMKSGLRGFLDEMAHGTGEMQLRLLKI